MIQKLCYFALYVFLMIPMSSCGQNSFGFGYGLSMYKGDLSQPGIFGDVGQAGMGFNAFYKIQIQKSLRLRAGVYFGQVQGDDSVSSNLAQQQRNLSFNNNLSEFHLLGEYNFSNDYLGASPFSFYVSLGGGVFSSNPKTSYNGLEYDLRPLKTENQPKSYAKYNPALIVGGGLEIELNSAISLTIELLGRATRFDYIDDVSGSYPNYNETLSNNGVLSANLSDRRDEFFRLPEGTTDIQGVGNKRGNPSSKDFYITAMFNFLVRLNNENYRGKNRKRILCPSAR